MDPCKEVSIHCQDVENLKWNPRGFGRWSFVNNRPFVTSNIIGATTMNQLKENIDSIDINLSKEALKEIEDIHLSDPNPCV